MKSTQVINITIPKELLEQVDNLAKRDYTSRSDIIRQALLAKIRRHDQDEWGDEGNWETLIDFREISPNGVDIDSVLSTMDKMVKENPEKYGRQA